ncbi:Capsular synthesis regulator component B [Buttiauxella agrestis]|uniref:Capsular synthesis regulator component B n=1 Tax=Buttiauxella agrestis TaxID=82977 RepID=A0A381C6C0_9ENTR|nr:LuxR C-terminal-related transcriptional regulator [Buttiauxella agrestis]SUW63387.1 Capsular synthesis regulator component B [Buttiauxella agrestis]
MDNISVYCDNCYVREAVRSIIGCIKNSHYSDGGLSVFVFEKTWLNEIELTMLLNCKSERVIVFAREALLGFFSSLMLPGHISFGRFDVALNMIRKSLADFINPTLKDLLISRRRVANANKLSPCETRVTSLYVQGISVMCIAKSMNKSFKTVSHHKRSAMKKMGISSNVELMLKGRIFLMMNKELLLAAQKSVA